MNYRRLSDVCVAYMQHASGVSMFDFHRCKPSAVKLTFHPCKLIFFYSYYSATFVGVEFEPLHWNIEASSLQFNSDQQKGMFNLTFPSITNKKLFKVTAVICLLWLVPFVTVISMYAAFDVDGTLRNNFFSNNTDQPE